MPWSKTCKAYETYEDLVINTLLLEHLPVHKVLKQTSGVQQARHGIGEGAINVQPWRRNRVDVRHIKSGVNLDCAGKFYPDQHS